MKEQFCTYEISLKLKELGFDEPCFAYKFKHNSPLSFSLICGTNMNTLTNSELDVEGSVCVPLWQQAWKFILNKLDEYSLCSAIKIFDDDSCVLYYLDTDESFDTQEQSIIYAIQIIEQNGN